MINTALLSNTSIEDTPIVDGKLKRLSDLKECECCIFVTFRLPKHINSHKLNYVNRMINMGLTKGKKIKVLKRFSHSTMMVSFDSTRIILESFFAHRIIVKRCDDEIE